jgi:hypothetical protein
MVTLSPDGFALVDSYVSSTAVSSLDINFDSPNGADKQIITGSITFASDGAYIRYKAYDNGQNALTSRTMSSTTNSTWGINSSTSGHTDLIYFQAGDADSGFIYGERINLYMEVNLGDVSTGPFYSPNIKCKTTNTGTDGIPQVAISNSVIHNGELERINLITNLSGNGIAAYNLKQYSLAHTGK